ncbi:MAG: amidohydrolase family protein [Pseudomonadota bacterium]
MTSFILKNGRIVDPSQDVDKIADLAIRDGRIAEIGDDLSDGPHDEILDLSGYVVAPGLIDLHAHVYGQGTAAEADALCGVGAGVTSLIDAGSAGLPEFDDLKESIISQCGTAVYSFLYNHWWPSGFESEEELSQDLHIEVDGLVDLAERFPEIVRGIKVAVMPPITRKYGLAPVEKGREAAQAAGLPMMLHVGDIGAPHLDATPREMTERALDLLAEGDVLTHLFCPLTGGLMDEKGMALPALKAAKDRGVIMDTAVGDYQFSWEAAERLLDQGFTPDVISSDAEVRPRTGPKEGVMVKDGRVTGERVASEMTLVEYMAFYFELGFDLPEILRLCTAAPARAAGIDDRAGDLKLGKPADISVLAVEEGAFRLTDVTGISRTGSKAFSPYLTIKNGQSYEPDSGPHPWGFSPPRLD